MIRRDSEKDIERRLAEQTRARKGMCIKLLSMHIKGLPDRMCLFPKGRIVFVELKTTGQKPKPMQLYIHERIRELGFRVEVIDTLKGVDELINEMTNAEQGQPT